VATGQLDGGFIAGNGHGRHGWDGSLGACWKFKVMCWMGGCQVMKGMDDAVFRMAGSISL